MKYAGWISMAMVCAAATLGCEASNTAKGTAVGTAIGAGTGAIIGERMGKGGAGTAIGAGIGALSGAAVGHGLDKSEQRMRQQQQQQYQQYPPVQTHAIEKFCPVGGEYYANETRYCPIHGVELREKQ